MINTINSKKISQLPLTANVANEYLIAVVNTTSGVTEKATISQLPTGANGITNVNNLGGGSSLGSVLGTELRLKTLIPGNALTFVVNDNTITINNNLNINTTGIGASFINSFNNPNLGLKSITGSNGITITDNTTSINISSSVNATLDSIIGSIEIPTVKLYNLENYINKAYTVNKIHVLNSSGTATVRLKRLDALGADVITSNTFIVGITRTTININSFTTSIGDQLVLEVLSSNNSINLSFTIELSYI